MSFSGPFGASQTPNALVGCLLDVSGSMRSALDTGTGDERAVERLRAVFSAALKLARAEQCQNPNALMFIGAFGLNNDIAPVVDLCGLVGSVSGSNGDQTGHELLISLANDHGLAHISKYIRDKFEDSDARILYRYLKRHRDQIPDFINAIPGTLTTRASEKVDGVLNNLLGASFIPSVVEDSKAIKMGRRICREWLLDFENFVPIPVGDVILLLERLQNHSSLRTQRGESSRLILNQTRSYLYGRTPMKEALKKSLAVFQTYNNVKQRALVVISDGCSTDGDPIPLANMLKIERVHLATVFLTSKSSISRRCLLDKPLQEWPDVGERTLFRMASTMDVLKHPVPVLASMGWTVPSSGECSLYTTVCSTDVLEEFCSVVLSARFGTADALLDIVGKVQLDQYVDDEHMKTRTKPSKQQGSTCYAHAAAAVLHMALVRIVGREGGCPDISEIRDRILRECPPGLHGRNIREVFDLAVTWYRPLKYREVDEDGAYQAVLRRRPVLATFRLSAPGWKAFSSHFTNPRTRTTALSPADMLAHRSSPGDGGHAVVLVRCEPGALTFLNSWGYGWGNNGSFSITSPAALEIDGTSEWNRMKFFDVFWYEQDLTLGERQAYSMEANKRVQDGVVKHPSILALEVKCPRCGTIAPIAEFTGSIRQALCSLCGQAFKPEPGHMIQAIYARAGLGDIE